MYNDYDSSPTVTNCTFSGNSATHTAAAGCTTTRQQPDGDQLHVQRQLGTSADGGGMYNDDYSSPTVTNCTFSGNSAMTSGGGMYNDDSSPTLTNCTFSGNSASSDGGGMCNDIQQPDGDQLHVQRQLGIASGGGMYNYSSNPT